MGNNQLFDQIIFSNAKTFAAILSIENGFAAFNRLSIDNVCGVFLFLVFIYRVAATIHAN